MKATPNSPMLPRPLPRGLPVSLSIPEKHEYPLFPASQPPSCESRAHNSSLSWLKCDSEDSNLFDFDKFSDLSLTNEHKASHSVFASTGDSELPVKTEERHSTILTLSSDSSEGRRTPLVISTANSMANEDGEDRHRGEFIGVAPSRMFCQFCLKHVLTDVAFEAPKQSVWERVCCAALTQGAERTQVVLHCCRNCRSVLAKLYSHIGRSN